MHIEKINDHQIRCTLNQKDLSDRELRISELAYGSEKAKALFRDMMQQASYELPRWMIRMNLIHDFLILPMMIPILKIQIWMI